MNGGKRWGRFALSFTELELLDPETLGMIFGLVRVYQAEPDVVGGCVRYEAMSEAFDVVPPGVDPAWYRLVVDHVEGAVAVSVERVEGPARWRSMPPGYGDGLVLVPDGLTLVPEGPEGEDDGRHN